MWRVWFVQSDINHDTMDVWSETLMVSREMGISWSEFIPSKGRCQNGFDKSIPRGKLTAAEIETTTLDYLANCWTAEV